jgi:putative membrane protein
MDTAQLVDTVVSGFINKQLAKPSKSHATAPGERSLAKGILAGLAAGIIATAAKTLVEKIYPSRTHSEHEPPEGIHWGLGMTAGAAYGALAEFYPAATARQGVSFGVTLLALTSDGALPALDPSTPPASQTTREKTSEIASHVIFGLVTETVRRTVRKRL